MESRTARLDMSKMSKISTKGRNVMAEYIERESAEKIASQYGCTNGVTLGRHSGIADCIAYEISKIPAADVVPVRHGRWGEASDGDGIVCPGCGTDFCTIINETEKFDFCPKCGCKMDLEE